MSSYYNNIPIYETINVSYGNIETLDTTTLKTKNLYIDNVKSSDKIITQTLTLDTKDIEELTISTNSPYTNDNKKICSKGYIDEQIDTSIPDLSNYVKNNEEQTLTNKFIMSNTSNEFNINKLKIKDYDNNNNTDTIEKIKTGGSSDNDTLTTKGYVDNSISSIPAPDLSNCVKNNVDQTLTNKFIMSNTSNELTAKKIRMKDYDTPNLYDTVEKIKLGGGDESFWDDTLPTVGFVEGHYVSNNGDQTLTNKFIMSNTSNELTANKLTLGTSKTITATTASSSSTQADDATLATQYYVDNNYVNKNDKVGEKYIYNYQIGEIFNNYNTNTAPNEYAHAEGYNTHATGKYSHAQNSYNTASGYASTAMGEWTTADQSCQLTIGNYNKHNNTGALFSVGNGTIGNNNDAFNVFNNGDVYIDKTININNKFNMYVGTITLKLEYNGTSNNYHTSFGVIYSWRDGNHKICSLSNARILLPKMTLTSSQKIKVSNLYDGYTTNGTSGFTNKYWSLYNIDNNLGGGFVKTSRLYQLDVGIFGLGSLHPYNNNAYELTTFFYENDYPALFFDNCWFCIKNYYSS